MRMKWKWMDVKIKSPYTRWNHRYTKYPGAAVPPAEVRGDEVHPARNAGGTSGSNTKPFLNVSSTFPPHISTDD